MTKIALVGHCGVDGPRIEAQIHSIVDAADVCSCNDADALNRLCGEGVDLLLFNRELGFGFDDEQGVDLMAEVRESHPDVKMMLMLGAFTGLEGALLSLIAGSVAGSLVGVAMLATRGRSAATHELPFGSFLAAGALILAHLGASGRLY